MKIYTKSGDKGETSLPKSKKVPKNHPMVEVVGCFDELNASLGLLHSIENNDIKEIVINLQKQLFLLGTYLFSLANSIDIEEMVIDMEKTIDKLSKKQKPLKNFILPGGSEHAAKLHVARAVCRRLERRVMGLKDLEELELSKEEYTLLIKYLNRLSDLLFVMARYVNFKLGIKEILWKKEK